MYTAIQTLASRLIEKSRAFLDFLSTLDDPHGDYRFALGARVDHLEAEVRELRRACRLPNASGEAT
jgi:hypothetical protein